MQNFHGISIDLAYDAIPGDPLRALLEAFPETARPGQLTLELSPAATIPGIAEDEWTPTFCHGLAQGYTRGDEHLLSDGGSLVEVRPRSGQLQATVRVPVTELASGMLHVGFCLLLREYGVFDAHAATALWKHRTLVVLGDAGAGKTTTLLGLMAAGASYLGDDRVLIRSYAGGVELLGYPRDFHLAPQTLRAHSYLGDRPAAAIDGKVRVAPRRAFPGRFSTRAAGPVVFLAPRVVDQATTSLARLDSAEAFGLLLAASAGVALEVLPHRSQQLELLRQLASGSTAVELRLGRDFLEQPARAGARVLEELAVMHA